MSAARPSRPTFSWTNQAAEAWAKFERYCGIIAFFLSGLYFLWAATASRTRMLWGDELYTLYVASLRNWGHITRLLASGGEFHPPFFYMLESACVSLFGATELALGLPSIAGFWLMTASLFLYLRARVSAPASLVGACFPMLAASSYFAMEARGYAMAMGFGSLALLVGTVRASCAVVFALAAFVLSFGRGGGFELLWRSSRRTFRDCAGNPLASAAHFRTGLMVLTGRSHASATPDG
jgi:hypothetical protein